MDSSTQRGLDIFYWPNPRPMFVVKAHKMFSSHKSKKGCKDQETIQSSTTPDPGYHMGKLQKCNEHHQQEPRGQPLEPPWNG